HRHLHSFPTRRSSDLIANIVCVRLELALVESNAITALKLKAGEGINAGDPRPRQLVENQRAFARHGRPAVVINLRTAEIEVNVRSEEHTSELQSRENL